MFNFQSDENSAVQNFFSDNSLLFLILSNIIMIFVALYENWDVITIMFIYWCQSVIIGIFTFFKILNLKNYTIDGISINNIPIGSTTGIKIVMAFFFLFHYGGFHFAYLFFIVLNPFFNSAPQTSFTNLGVLLIISVFFVNHLFSFLYNKKRDAQKIQNLRKVMGFPYMRIIPMHLTIIFGGIFLISGAPQITLILFLLLKTFADVAMHIVEHRESVASKINIILDKENYAIGEIISGKLYLDFNRPIKAKALKVAFIAEKITTQSGEGSYKEIFYQDEKILSNERYFGKETYDFFIKIPEDLFIKSDICTQTGHMGRAQKMVEKVQNWGIPINFQGYDRFYIKAILDVKISMDITNTQYIIISKTSS
jgi:hypothetical protein